MTHSIQSTILRRAALIAGGARNLAELMGATPEDVIAWMHDERVPPLEVFMRAVDLTVLTDCKRVGADEALRLLRTRLTSSLQRPA